MRDLAKFLAEFLGKPKATGAIAPSSRRLARAMVDWFDWSDVQTAVEYGPGTGAFTGAILGKLKPDATHFAIELNREFVEVLKRRFPDVTVYCDSVENVRQICARQEIDRVDVVICGLPWAAFSDSEQTRYLDALISVLPPGGRFATFAYLQGLLLPAGRRFRRKLHDYFPTVETSPVVWANLPPAIVYRCRH